MADPKKKGALAIIVGAPSSGAKMAPKMGGDAGGSSDELGVMAMKKFMAAMASGNAAAAWQAFKAGKDACYSEPDGDESGGGM